MCITQGHAQHHISPSQQHEKRRTSPNTRPKNREGTREGCWCCTSLQQTLHTGELAAGRGNGLHDPIHGFLSIKLALLPLGSVQWTGLEQLPELGISQSSIPWEEGAGSPTCGCCPARPRGGGGDKRHPNLQPWELLVLATQP